MKNSATKFRSKELLVGFTLRGAFLFLLGFLVSIGAGMLPVGVDIFTKSVQAFAPYQLYLRIGVGLLMLFCCALLLAPLRTGREAWFVGAAFGYKRSKARILYWFAPKRALRCTLFRFVLHLCKGVWAVIFLLPGLFMIVGTLYAGSVQQYDYHLLFITIGGGAVLLLVGGWFYLATVQRYFLVMPILINNPRVSLRYAMQKSAIIMDGQCKETARLKLSFLPLMLLNVLIFPAIYVLPYYRQSCACRSAELLRG